MIGAKNVVTLLATALLLGFFAEQATAQGWPTTEWIVTCDAELRDTLPASACDQFQATGPASAYEYALEAASEWLSGLGFNPPVLEMYHYSGKYAAYISDQKNENDKGEIVTGGFYSPSDETIYFNSEDFFAIGATEEALLRNSRVFGYPAHELFHAIQAAYGTEESIVADERSWIVEGTATAVMYASLRRRQIAVTPKTRYYDIPLHKPLCGPVNGVIHHGCYATHDFWNWLGQEFGSQDNVAYLDVLFQQDLSSGSGLGGVDAAVRQWNEDGLYDLYPQFIASYANSRNFYQDIREVGLTYTGPKIEKTVSGTVKEMAADAIAVTVTVPAGKQASFEIKVKNDDPDLHLIVDELRVDIGLSKRNLYKTRLSASTQTFLIRVANVARDAAQTEPQSYALQLTLEPPADCSFEAEVQGGFQGKRFFKVITADGSAHEHVSATLSDLDGTTTLDFVLEVPVTGVRRFRMIVQMPLLAAGETGTFDAIGIVGITPEDDWQYRWGHPAFRIDLGPGLGRLRTDGVISVKITQNDGTTLEGSLSGQLPVGEGSPMFSGSEPVSWLVVTATFKAALSSCTFE